MSLPASDPDAVAPDTPAMPDTPATLVATGAVVVRIAALLATGPLLIASDFDGTLAELTLDPWGARIVPRARRALRRLAADPRVRVAFISGRAVADLATRVRVGGASYRGDHGAERAEAARGFRVDSLQPTREPTSELEADLVRRLVHAVPAEMSEAWLVVEDKVGSVTFHFRGAPDVDQAHARVLEVIERVDQDEVLQRSGGRRAIELRPTGAATKADALRQLIDEFQPAAVVMLGDDRNDALAFDVVRLARTAGEIDGLAIAVAGHADVTAAVAPRADIVLAGPRETAHLLASLAACVERTA